MPGMVTEVRVKVGAKVSAGEIIAILEAMKMEVKVVAEIDGVVEDVHVKPGDSLDAKDLSSA